MKFSDALKPEELSKLATHTVKVGDVYEITMTEANGIKPKAGDCSRDKYFIVLGFDSNGVAYGGVIINSQINKNLFLRYDSFVDCVRLKIAHPQKFNEWNYLGEVDEYDVELIIGTIKESPAESIEHLSQFGL